jgi:hypothetical protein
MEKIVSFKNKFKIIKFIKLKEKLLKIKIEIL